ncbi:MAG TPA: hypothetical protein VKA00_00690 [Trueperaceae bacterium]|nr:hypothetical protein [Trueperaceae bacterium]
MTNRTPHHLEARLQRALADIKRLARDRGLEEAYASELFGLEHQVQEAVDAHARGLAEYAVEAVRRLAQRLLGVAAEEGLRRRSRDTPGAR